MSYTALYRKFRPTTFEDVKGQDAIVKTLKNQISGERTSHAYLFCGTRGTGKTTVAKILAKAVNCEHPVNGSPCGECRMCKSIAEGSSMNVIEIDAASNNGVDNIREIREEVSYRPAEGKYKVYIIDEVHMLSAGAYNALLKTLEEPPEYVIFILATTEAHKIPITILSRCQRYDFKHISLGTIEARLKELIDKEGWDVEDRAVRYIARKADGSMRDSLSLLDQCVAFYLGERLTYDHVLEVLGAVDTEVFSRLLRQILEMDVHAVISTVDELVIQGRELSQLATDFTWYLRNLLLVKSSDDMEDILDVSTENLGRLKEEAQMIDDETLMRFIRIFSELSNQLKFAVQKRVLLEVTLIKLCRPAMDQNTDALADRVKALEKQAEEGAFQPKVISAPTVETKTAVPVEKPKLPSALPEEVRKAATEFKRWRNDECISAGVRGYLRQAHVSADDNGRMLIVFEDPVYAKRVSTEENIQEIKEAAAQYTGKNVEIEIRTTDPGRKFEDQYIDLGSQINFEITQED